MLVEQKELCDNQKEIYCDREIAKLLSRGEYYDPLIGAVVKVTPNVTNITLNISTK